MHYVYHLNIGSNIGRRGQCLRRAVIMLAAGNGGCALSQVIESEPWGFSSPNAFLNVGVKLWSRYEPLEMLHIIHDIERRLGSASHRDSEGNYADRAVDIDIIAVQTCQPLKLTPFGKCDGETPCLSDYCTWCSDGNIVIDLPELQVPHPLMHKREFVLRPMAQIAPEWLHPTLGGTASQLLEQIASL